MQPVIVTRFDLYGSPDAAEVLNASTALKVTEFRLFELAWSDWYGTPPDERNLERCFAVYRFTARVPFWVRRFTRRVLEPAASIFPDVSPPTHSPQPPGRRNALAVKISYLVLLLLFVLLAISVFNSGFHLLDFYRSCYFPPCYTAN